MVMTWFAGVHGLTSGCANARFLRAARVPDLTSAAHAAASGHDVMDFAALMGSAELSAKLAHVKITFPLSIAEAILGGLLVLASGLAMSGRRGSRSLAIQAIVANVLLAIVAYVATQRVRAAWIDIVTRAAVTLPAGAPQRDAAALLWAARIKLILLEISPLLLAWLALTRRRARTFFDAVAQRTESAEDP
jgi:hypothetical protein